MKRQPIRELNGRILGFVETYDNGDKKATDFAGRILGYYRHGSDTTTDFAGRILTRGDSVVGLIYKLK